MDRNTSRGIASVRRIKRQYNLDGVYGTLAELIEVNETYRTAVEVTAGASLFHYVVDTDDTATRVLEVLQREKGGRITFMPLNRLRPRPSGATAAAAAAAAAAGGSSTGTGTGTGAGGAAELPKSADAIPMLDKVQHDARFRPALEHVFGKTIICPSLPVAAHYARTHGVNAITPDGDFSDKRGALTGGFYDPRRSRLEAVRAAARWRAELDALRARADALRAQLERADAAVTRAVGDAQRAEQRRRQLDARLGSGGQLRAELRAREAQLAQLQAERDAAQRAGAASDASVRELGAQLAAWEAELAAAFETSLAPHEQQQLGELDARVQRLRRQCAALSTRRSEREARKTVLEVELRENLRPRREQLREHETDDGFGDGGAEGGDDSDGDGDGNGGGSGGRSGGRGRGRGGNGGRASGGGNGSGGGGGGRTSLRDKERELKRVVKAAEAAAGRLRDAEAALERTAAQLAQLQQAQGERQAQQEELARQLERHQKRVERSMAKKALLTEKAAECSRNIRDLGVLPEEAFEKFENTSSAAVSPLQSSSSLHHPLPPLSLHIYTFISPPYTSAIVHLFFIFILSMLPPPYTFTTPFRQSSFPPHPPPSFSLFPSFHYMYSHTKNFFSSE